jgi:hypothetical protein
MTLQLYINGKWVATQPHDRGVGNTKHFREKLFERYKYAIARAESWDIFLCGVPSKMNHPHFRIQEDKKPKRRYHKRTKLLAA